ncbi:hypothetical protein PS2_031631 [Malus domestica]
MADIEEYSNDDDFGYSREYNSDDASYNEDYNDGFGDFDKGLHNHDNIDYDRYLNKRKPFFNLDDYVGAPARVGLVAPIDLDPSQTSFFQVLNIPTKINQGTVEIITPVELIKKGDQVNSSEAALLAQAILIRSCRPDCTYDNGFRLQPRATYMFLHAYKNVLALSFATDYNLPQAEMSRSISRGSKQASLLLPQPPVAAAAKQEERQPQLVDMEVTFAQSIAFKSYQ